MYDVRGTMYDHPITDTACYNTTGVHRTSNTVHSFNSKPRP